MNLPSVIILFGPPGAGKGTQAEILAEKFGFFHFETSKIIEEVLRTHGDDERISVGGEEYSYRDEKQKFSSGTLNAPVVVAFWVKQRISELAKNKKPMVFSGSPRTLYEAEQIFPFLLETFPRETLRVVDIGVPPEVSLERNSARRICSSCRLPHQKKYEGDRCRKCGSVLVRRGALDTPDVIKKRLEEFTARTRPAIEKAGELGFPLSHIDGVGTEEEIAEKISLACGFDPNT